MTLDPSKVLELLTALAAGGILTAVVKAWVDRGKSQAEAGKIAVEGELSLVEMAMRMTDKLQGSLKNLEDKTEELARKNLKLEQELSELRLSNINLLREIEALKRQNDDLEKTCGVLIKENNHLRVELDNCIKKEL